MKKMTSLIILLLIAILGMSITSEASISHSTEEDPILETHEFYVNKAQLYFESEIYDMNSIIDLSINLNLSNEISDYDLECIGFEVVKDIIVTTDKITFSVRYIEDEEKPYLNFLLNLTDNVHLSMSVYGYLKKDKLFISRSSFKEAENVYLDYLQENDIDEYERIRSEKMPCHDPIKPSNLMNLPSSSLLTSNPDTYVEGNLIWYDDYDKEKTNPHPLQFNLVELWDKNPLVDTLMASTYTDENGFYHFEFHNADSFLDFENGGYDVFVRVLPMGENTGVYKDNKKSYQQDLGYWPDIPTGTTHNVSNEFFMKEVPNENIEWDKYDFTFSQALQISQAVIFASKYVKEMNGENINSVSVRYPHIGEQAEKESTFYKYGEATIYLEQPKESQSIKTYAAWDAIMHEYGHHVQWELSCANNPGATHWIETRMGDHYMHHFHGFPFSSNSSSDESKCSSCVVAIGRIQESECKLQGNRIAWAEGWATYFGVVAQQYFADNLCNIRTVGDSNYEDFKNNFVSLREFHKKGEDNEATIQSILYEMYDDSNNDFFRDSLALGHKVMWDLTTGVKVETFQEFDTYFRANCTDKNQIIDYGRILGHYSLAPSAPAAITISTVSSTFYWDWRPSDPSKYFNDTEFELNFYDYNYNLIGKSSKASDTRIAPSEDLWKQVINSGYMFFVSVTRYEGNSPVSSYEGEWESFSRPSASPMSLSSQYTGKLGTVECYWFSFKAPQTATFVFETTGSTDTYGELFPQMVIGRTSEGRITFDDDSGEGTNFKISYSMNKGNVVYLRVIGFNWSQGGEFTLSISSPDHVHEYTYSYTSKNDKYHMSICSCGTSIQESHSFYADKLGNRCKYCGYFVKGLVPVPFPTTGFKNPNYVAFLEKKEDEII